MSISPFTGFVWDMVEQVDRMNLIRVGGLASHIAPLLGGKNLSSAVVALQECPSACRIRRMSKLRE